VTWETVNGYVPLTSLNITVLVAEVTAVPARVTLHAVPVGRPVSVKMTAYFRGAKARETAAGPSFTVTRPDEGVDMYPCALTTKEYCPLISRKVTEVPVEELVTPSRTTLQLAPGTRPVSVNVTRYLAAITLRPRVVEFDTPPPAADTLKL
jgi:hypothetical protein